MKKRKKYIIIAIIVLLIIGIIELWAYLSTRYSTSYSYEHIYVDGPIQQQGFDELIKEDGDYVFCINSGIKDEEPKTVSEVSVFKKDKIFRKRYQFKGYYLPQNEFGENIRNESISMINFSDEDNAYIVVFGISSKEKPIESYTVEINGEEIIKKPEGELILDIYKTDWVSSIIKEVKYKNN